MLIPQHVQSELFLFRPINPPRTGAFLFFPDNVEIIAMRDEAVDVGSEVCGVELTKNFYNLVYLREEEKKLSTEHFTEAVIKRQLRAVFDQLHVQAQFLIGQVINTEQKGTLVTVSQPVPFGVMGSTLEVDGIFYRWTLGKGPDGWDTSLVEVLVGTKVE